MKGLRVPSIACALAVSIFTVFGLDSAAPKAPAARPPVSAGLAEIIKMNDSGVADGVIKEFIKGSSTIYDPRADEIIYMHDHGVSGDVITAVIQRGAELKKALPPPSAPPPVAASPAPAVAQQAPVVQPVQPLIQPVQPLVQPAPVYTYTQPSPVYVYSYASYPYYYPYYGGYSYYYRSPSYCYPPLYTHTRFYVGSPWRYSSGVHFNARFGGHGAYRVGGHFGGGSHWSGRRH